MDVSVDADAGLAVGLGHDQVGGFTSHALERQQLLDGVGDAPAKFGQQVAANLPNHPRLGPIESNRIDGFFQFRRRKFEHPLRSVRDRKQPLVARLGDPLPQSGARVLEKGSWAADIVDELLAGRFVMDWR